MGAIARLAERVEALESQVAELLRAQADADARVAPAKPAAVKKAAAKAKG